MNNFLFLMFASTSVTNSQQQQLLYQIQQHVLSSHQALILYLMLILPIPIPWRLGLYHFFITLPIPTLSPFATLFLITVGPIGIILFLYFTVLILLKSMRFFVPVLVRVLKKEQAKKAFLELTIPSDTDKSAYATEQLYILFHTLAREKGFWEKFLGKKKEFSLEIVSTKNEGIRYMLVVDEENKDIVRRNLISYLPEIKIKEVNDYFRRDLDTIANKNFFGIAELRLSRHFALPLKTQKQLSKHDPISYLTGNMTKLKEDELIAFQVITTPLISSLHEKEFNEIKSLRLRMYKGQPLTPFLQKNVVEEVPGISLLWTLIKVAFSVFKFLVMFIYSMIVGFFDTSGKTVPFLQQPEQTLPQDLLNPYEQELKTIVKEKIDQPLFETSIRFLVSVKDQQDFKKRLSGLVASFGPMASSYQSLVTKDNLPILQSFKRRFTNFKNRGLSQFSQNLFLSASEMSDIFHFPYTGTTKTEDILKSLSPDLPAPLALKNAKLDVVFAKNSYANSEIPIGLTNEERTKHMYILGRTGSGKSTIIFHMAKNDVQKGRGLAVIDPHGDLAQGLLTTVPKERINDFIYLNPFDLKYPIGINLLELPEGLSDDELELEKELVAESVISVFRRIFSKEEYVNAHRIEYILRNTIYTSFAVPNRTLFTLYKLLNDSKYRGGVVGKLDDENLRNFWRNEFGKAGAYQMVKMISGVTAKIGRFLFSPTARRMIEQEKSTIDFEDIIEKQKILICNLSEGKIGEDTAQVLGLTVLAKIHQAALRRARKDLALRKPFYLYVDEFQNFATTSFTRILSGGRKFGLFMTLAEQSTAQQKDRDVINVILANTGTVICFATASPLDGQMMESEFSSYITKEDLANLPKFKFYIKMSALEPREPFSGETIKPIIKDDKKLISDLIEASRKNYAIVYTRPKKQKENTNKRSLKQASGKSIRNIARSQKW